MQETYVWSPGGSPMQRSPRTTTTKLALQSPLVQRRGRHMGHPACRTWRMPPRSNTQHTKKQNWEINAGHFISWHLQEKQEKKILSTIYKVEIFLYSTTFVNIRIYNHVREKKELTTSLYKFQPNKLFHWMKNYKDYNTRSKLLEL